MVTWMPIPCPLKNVPSPSRMPASYPISASDMVLGCGFPYRHVAHRLLRPPQPGHSVEVYRMAQQVLQYRERFFR
jgi:hypothetical protein